MAHLYIQIYCLQFRAMGCISYTQVMHAKVLHDMFNMFISCSPKSFSLSFLSSFMYRNDPMNVFISPLPLSLIVSILLF